MTFASFHYLLQGKHFELQNRGQHVALCFLMLNSWSLFDFFCIYLFLFQQRFGNHCFSISLTFGHLELSRAWVTHVSCVKWSNVASRGQIQLQSQHSKLAKLHQGFTDQVAVMQVTEKCLGVSSALRELGVKMPAVNHCTPVKYFPVLFLSWLNEIVSISLLVMLCRALGSCK